MMRGMTGGVRRRVRAAGGDALAARKTMRFSDPAHVAQPIHLVAPQPRRAAISFDGSIMRRAFFVHVDAARVLMTRLPVAPA
jgi:hypothetical protein